MNLEEAKANIGKEVVLDESTKPYRSRKLKLEIHKDDFTKGVLLSVIDDMLAKVDTLDGFHLFINIKNIKLKEQPMNYKIRVTPETSAEVQELFFELGYGWRDNGKKVFRSEDVDVIYSKEDYIFYRSNTDPVPENYDGYKKITLPQLRDMVVLKRNSFIYGSVQDAVNAFQKSIENKEDLQMAWQDALGAVADGKYLKPKEPNMTWQDALRAVADGKEVEVTDGEYWVDIAVCCIQDLEDFKGFRLAPQRITLHNSYTKEELLKIAGEME